LKLQSPSIEAHHADPIESREGRHWSRRKEGARHPDGMDWLSIGLKASRWAGEELDGEGDAEVISIATRFDKAAA
jgi:hypothetical protein